MVSVSTLEVWLVSRFEYSSRMYSLSTSDISRKLRYILCYCYPPQEKKYEFTSIAVLVNIDMVVVFRMLCNVRHESDLG